MMHKRDEHCAQDPRQETNKSKGPHKLGSKWASMIHSFGGRGGGGVGGGKQIAFHSLPVCQAALTRMLLLGSPSILHLVFGGSTI